MFKDTMGKGFQMTFANGNTISVQFGYGNYCENNIKNYKKENVNLWGHELTSKNAEVATWDKDGNWNLKDFMPDASDVKGYMTANEVLELMIKAAK